MDPLGKNLVFLISLPRSGSTLLQRILAGHPQIGTAPEPWIMLQPIYALKTSGFQAEYEAPLAKKAVDAFLANQGGDEVYLEAIRAMASVLYGRALEKSGKKYFLDKTPRYYLVIPELQRVFPEARFIFLFRNPLAVLSSVLSTWFRNNPNHFSKSYNSQDMLRGPLLLLQGSRLPARYSATLTYESLVSSPEETVSRLCNVLNLSFHRGMIDYGGTPMVASELGDQSNIHVNTKPVAESLDKWQKNLARKDLVELSKHYLHKLGKDIVEQSGYDFALLERQLTDIGDRL